MLGVSDAGCHLEDVIALTKPLIAAVNGHAIGLGAVLASLSDVSYIAETAKFGDLHSHAALPAGNGAAVIWPLLVGFNRAKQLLMAGELLTAADAERFGLVTRMLPAAEVMDAAMAMAVRLAAMAPKQSKVRRPRSTAFSPWRQAQYFRCRCRWKRQPWTTTTFAPPWPGCAADNRPQLGGPTTRVTGAVCGLRAASR
jgi:enoyl-CoA hydratase/carnithine racemase